MGTAVLAGWEAVGPNAPVQPLLDQDAVGQIVTAPAEKTTSTVSRFALEMVLDRNTWMGTHGLRVDL